MGKLIDLNAGGAKAPSFFVAIPSHDVKICVNTVASIVKSMQVFQVNKLDYQFRFEAGCCYISMARNNLVVQFLESGCTDLVFVDSDVGFEGESFAALLGCDVELVAGIYPKKGDKDQWPVVLVTDEFHRPIVRNGLLIAESLPTGFMKIKRSVIEKLIEAHPELKYMDSLTSKVTYDLFGTFVEDGRWFGDDYGFCHRWTKIGGECFVLPDISFTHAGNKNFKGNFHDHLMSLPPAKTGEKTENPRIHEQALQAEFDATLKDLEGCIC